MNMIIRVQGRVDKKHYKQKRGENWAREDMAVWEEGWMH